MLSRDYAIADANPQLLTSREVAGMFGVSSQTVRNWTVARTFPAPVGIPGRLLWRTEDVQRAYQEFERCCGKRAA